jgi:beta-glucosidase
LNQVSDWEDIIRLHTRDKVAETPEEAVRMAVMAGVDMSMVPFNFSFYDHCVELSKKNNDFVKRTNDAVLRILRVKKLVGILKHSASIYPNDQDIMSIGTEESEKVALEASRESIVLAANNNNILPLNKSSKILIVGPSSNLLKVLNGGWSYKW